MRFCACWATGVMLLIDRADPSASTFLPNTLPAAFGAPRGLAISTRLFGGLLVL